MNIKIENATVVTMSSKGTICVRMENRKATTVNVEKILDNAEATKQKLLARLQNEK